jgi:hypothetical protein
VTVYTLENTVFTFFLQSDVGVSVSGSISCNYNQSKRWGVSHDDKTFWKTKPLEHSLVEDSVPKAKVLFVGCAFSVFCFGLMDVTLKANRCG